MLRAVFVVGGLDVYVELSGQYRFFLSGINRGGGERCPLGVARWEPGDIAFDLHLAQRDVYFPTGSELMQSLVDKLDAVRTWYLQRQVPDPRLGILLSDNTVPQETHVSLSSGLRR